MKFLVSTVAAFLFASSAFANDLTGPAWVCSLDADVSGYSVGFILNVTKIDGEGTIKCSRPEDQMNVTVPVEVRLGGLGLGLGISKVKSMKVASLAVGVTDPSDMLGEFNAGVEADFTFIKGGAGIQIGVQGDNGLAFEVGVTGKKADGLNVKAGGFALIIEQTGEAVYTPFKN